MARSLGSLKSRFASFVFALLLVLAWLASFGVHQAHASPLLQLPWPTGQTHNISAGYGYDCGDHLGKDRYAIDFNLPSDQQGRCGR
jgi:hypothetical protein